MKSKQERLKAILEIVKTNSINNQEELLQMLKEQGFETTQATLSRDMKELKIGRIPDENGNYKYTIQTAKENVYLSPTNELTVGGFISLEFSDKLGIIKTRPGYAQGIASDIDTKVSHVILGTIAGDDTILLIPRENFSREEIINALSVLF
ncbi:transcriptional regulator of arginine metabolism [Dysgonomonadaceae bacterium PH5-43]|nr:transcriptional regulator of arginine metabolism [Dysgonomonadaceae bacterium PH5-43]